jgi:hypothetical protein
MGDLVDTPLKAQEWSPGAWSQALQNTTSGASMEYSQATSVFSDTHQLLSETDFIKAGGSEADYAQYKQSWQTDRATTAIAQVAYDKINKDEADIKAMQQQIESAPNTKAAADLRNRIAIEQADISVQQNRLNATALNLKAAQAANKLDEKKAEVEFEK